MGADTDGALLDPRLRFPVHALPDERVVWAGTAKPRAFIVGAAHAVLVAMLFASMLGVFVWMSTHTNTRRCRIKVDTSTQQSSYRDCTDAERAERAAYNSRLRWIVLGGLGALVALAVVGLWVSTALRRRHLVYVVTNERVIVQDGVLGVRLDTIDLDHVVAITAVADWVSRWFRLKSIVLVVPGQRFSPWHRIPLANAVTLWGIDAQDPALSQLLNVWLPRQRR